MGSETLTDLKRRLPLNAGQVSRLLKRLRVHGLIKRVGRTYKGQPQYQLNA